ncbi:SIVA protein, partial [Pachycephala philippinensis]|nr:SIVA protein [Pachycephala philippinensis]
MPKRSCPFGDAAPLQLKTRVGLRELSRGVRGEDYRREAYMEGAAAAARPAEPGPCGEAQGEGPRWSGQLLIGHDGKLRRRPADRAVPPVGASRACSSCVRTADVKDACAQCDRFICQSCSRLCSCCNMVTCSLCSTVDYGDVGEQVLCNGCSIFQV